MTSRRAGAEAVVSQDAGRRTHQLITGYPGASFLNREARPGRARCGVAWHGRAGPGLGLYESTNIHQRIGVAGRGAARRGGAGLGLAGRGTGANGTLNKPKDE